MSNSRRWAGWKARVSLFILLGTGLCVSMQGQIIYQQHPASPMPFPTFGNFAFNEPSFYPAPRAVAPVHPLISADLLRHPLSAKAARALAKAQKRGAAGDRAGALQDLREALAKYPKESPYTHNLMGLQYVGLKQYALAKNEFAEVLKDMPHVSANHFNYGLALAELGEDRRAELEMRTALVLDENNQQAAIILKVLTEPAPQTK